MLFFWHDLIFLTPYDKCKSIFVQDGVKQIFDGVICFHRLIYKTMQTFDIVLKKIHCHSVNRFNGVFLATVPGGGNSWYFRTGVCHYKISISNLSGIFDEKVGPFSEVLCLMEISKVRFWGLFWEKKASMIKKFPKTCGFLVQTRSKKSISSVFFCFVMCVIKITDPIWNFLQIL